MEETQATNKHSKLDKLSNLLNMVKLPNAILQPFLLFLLYHFMHPKGHKREIDTKVSHCLNKFSA